MTPDAFIPPERRDAFGMFCSGVCVVQCAAPLLLAFFGGSLAGVAFPDNEDFHLLLLAVVPGIAVWSLVPGYRRHLRRRPLAFAVLGILLLFLGVIIAGSAEVPLTIAGGLLMIVAHAMNRQGVLAARIT